MKIIIDFNTMVPSKDLMDIMTNYKNAIEKALEPIREEFENSEGILILHTDKSFELKETPYNMVMKIRELIEKPAF